MVRHEIVQKVVQAYERYKKDNTLGHAGALRAAIIRVIASLRQQEIDLRVETLRELLLDCNLLRRVAGSPDRGRAGEAQGFNQKVQGRWIY